MFSDQFIKARREHLLHRRGSKIKILESGGEQTLSHSWKDITRIDFALRRIDEGQYGLCASCGTPIAKSRLSIVPETPFCLECAKSIEAS